MTNTNENIEQVESPPVDTTNVFWHGLFLGARNKLKPIKTSEFSRMFRIHSQYVRTYEEQESPINMQTRLLLLDFHKMKWSRRLMLMVLGDSKATAIFQYMLDTENSDDVFYVSGSSSTDRYWQQFITFLVKELDVDYQADIAEIIGAQAPTLSALMAGRADIRTDQKITLYSLGKLGLNELSLKALLPKGIRANFVDDLQYERFLHAILNDEDIGPPYNFQSPPPDPKRMTFHIVRSRSRSVRR